MESFAKIFVWFVILGTYFLCAFSTDLLWLGQTGVAFLVFCITFSILNEIIDDYLTETYVKPYQEYFNKLKEKYENDKN